MQIRFLFLFGLIILCGEPLYAGAWTVTPGKWKRYHDITYYNTDYYYDDAGNRQNQDRYLKFEIGSRAEYGLQDGLTFGASSQLAAVKGSQSFEILTSSSRFSNITVTLRQWNVGLADPKFYLRKRLWQDDASVLSAQATLKTPSIFHYRNLPRSGSDKFSYEARLLAGHNFEWLEGWHYANLEAAYELRPHNDGDLFHLDATTGLNFDDSFTLLPQLFTTWRMDDSANRFTQTSNDSYDLVKGQLSAVIPLTREFSLQAGAAHHLYGRNTGGGTSVTLSLWAK